MTEITTVNSFLRHPNKCPVSRTNSLFAAPEWTAALGKLETAFRSINRLNLDLSRWKKADFIYLNIFSTENINAAQKTIHRS
jgi:hypothetical protein